MNIQITNPQKAETFASIFQHIKTFTDNINIMFEKERMYIQSMDNSRISIFEIILPKEWFDKYEITNKQNINIGINSVILFRILNSKEKTQTIEIVYNAEEENDKLNLHFISDNKTEFNKHFEVPLIELEVELMEIPNLEHDAEMTVSSVQFSTMINQLKMFGDTIDIHCCEDKILLNSNSPESGKMSVEMKIDDLNSFSINEGQTMKLSFSLNYLHNICLYNKIAKEMEIGLKDNFPMKIVYKLNGYEDAKLIFYLAPKINDDEDG